MATKKDETVVEEEVVVEEKKSTGKKVSEGMSAAGEKVGEGVDVASEKVGEGVDVASKTLGEALRQVEGIGKALGSALSDRANVVMVRVNNESLQYLDMLVEADITKSRSESAAFLINEGIKSNKALFDKIRNITDQISALRAQLRESVDVGE
jgi:regulator of replication initiation timing